MDKFIEKLRIALAASLKYHFVLIKDPAHKDLWKKVLNKEKLGSIDSMVGDCFAFWYGELRGDPEYYQLIAAEFFENL